jgi:hypothetical protein
LELEGGKGGSKKCDRLNENLGKNSVFLFLPSIENRGVSLNHHVLDEKFSVLVIQSSNKKILFLF